MITLQLQRAVTTNLTLVQQVAKEHTGLDALPGYVLVVFERREQGSAVFSRLVNSGESFSSRFKIPFRDLSQKYFAIAVNDSVLSCVFEHPIVLEDGSGEFSIKFHLTYRVADPRKVAELLEHDPLQQLRDEVVRVIGRNCAKRKAEMFRDRFRDLERIVIDSESVRLRPYAAELGFRIISIDLDKPLPDYRGQITDVRHRAEAKKDHYEIEPVVNRLKRQASRIGKHELHQEDLNHKDDIQPRGLEEQIVPSEKPDEVDQPEPDRKLQDIQTDSIGQALAEPNSDESTPAQLHEDPELVHEIAPEAKLVTQPPVQHALPAVIEDVQETGQQADGEVQTKGIDDGEPTTTDLNLVDEVVEQSLLRETWRNEASRFVRAMEEAGADPDITTRVRDDLEAMATQYFPPRN
jgi:hypothetical protein